MFDGAVHIVNALRFLEDIYLCCATELFSFLFLADKPSSDQSMNMRTVHLDFLRERTGDSSLPHTFAYFRMALSPLATTTRAAPTSAKTAIHMVAIPMKVRAKNTAFTVRAKAIFCTKMA